MQVNPTSQIQDDGIVAPRIGSQRSRILAADRAFVAHPEFGATAAIAGRALERYRFVLELLAEPYPELARLVDPVADPEIGHRVFRDPLVRIVMNDGFERFAQGNLDRRGAAELERVLAGAIEAAAQGLGYMEARLTRRLRIGPPSNAWLWSFEGSQDASVQKLQDKYRDLVVNRLSAHDWVVGVPTPDTARHLHRAGSLLTDLLPESGRSALEFISAVSITTARTPWGSMLSGSGGDGLPSTIYLSPDNLHNPWDTSNHLFHEGLHLKLFDVGLVFSLTEPDVPKLAIPWRPETWTVIRVVYSLHVYSHLLLYKAALDDIGASLHGAYGDPQSYPPAVHPLSGVSHDENATYGSAPARARYFFDQLAGAWSAHLTADGRRFIDWLYHIARPFGLAREETP